MADTAVMQIAGQKPLFQRCELTGFIKNNVVVPGNGSWGWVGYVGLGVLQAGMCFWQGENTEALLLSTRLVV